MKYRPTNISLAKEINPGMDGTSATIIAIIANIAFHIIFSWIRISAIAANKTITAIFANSAISTEFILMDLFIATRAFLALTTSQAFFTIFVKCGLVFERL
ncbi:MAG: hypothetical protein KGO96_06950 [Elusimicrobia bacterium]|nr:hypothetical protein [Elusimicrobiota bacterium]